MYPSIYAKSPSHSSAQICTSKSACVEPSRLACCLQPNALTPRSHQNSQLPSHPPCARKKGSAAGALPFPFLGSVGINAVVPGARLPAVSPSVDQAPAETCSLWRDYSFQSSLRLRLEYIPAGRSGSAFDGRARRACPGIVPCRERRSPRLRKYGRAGGKTNPAGHSHPGWMGFFPLASRYTDSVLTCSQYACDRRPDLPEARFRSPLLSGLTRALRTGFGPRRESFRWAFPEGCSHPRSWAN